jgi:cell division protein DivIC
MANKRNEYDIHRKRLKAYSRKNKAENIRKRNIWTFRGIALILLILVCVLLVQTNRLSRQKAEYEVQLHSYEESYEAESEKSEELESEKNWVKSDQYVESVAREKLGLVNSDEVLIKSKN